MTAMTTYTSNGNPCIDGLLTSGGGLKWSSSNLTYSFPTSNSFYGSNYGGFGEANGEFAEFNSVQKNAVSEILSMYSAVSELKFNLISETDSRHADLRFGRSESLNAAARGYGTANLDRSGDVWLHISENRTTDPKESSLYTILIHEIGHTLGLYHPNSPGVIPKEYTSEKYTVMKIPGYQQSPMIFDIAAIQHMYGANFYTNNSNTLYKWDPDSGETFINGVGQGKPAGYGGPFRTIWDGGGTDTYDFSSYKTTVNIDLRPGEFTTFSQTPTAWGHTAQGIIGNALLYNGDTRSLIENAIGGSGNDTIVGNQGNNTLDGGPGADTLIGGAGDDIYYVDNEGDVVIENPNEGIDTVITTLNRYSLGSNIENLILQKPGYGSGNQLNNEIHGSSGNDRLWGYRGDDILRGGAGSDTYVYNFRNFEGCDTIYELPDSAAPNDVDVLTFGVGITPEEIWFQKKSESDGVHLEISRIGTNNEKVTVKNWFDQNCRIERMDIYWGKSITDDKVDQLVNAMAAFSPPALGEQSLPPNYQQALIPIITAAWS